MGMFLKYVYDYDGVCVCVWSYLRPVIQPGVFLSQVVVLSVSVVVPLVPV